MFKTKTKKKYDEMEQEKIPLKFDIVMLNNIIGYLFKKSSQITRKSLVNMKRLFDIIDERIYEGNEKMEARIYFINRALKAKIDEGFENDDAIINYCSRDTYDKENEEIIKNIDDYKKLNYEEIRYINKAIQDRLQFSYLYNIKDKIYSAAERIDSGEYNSFAEIKDEMYGVCTELVTKVRSAKSVEDTNRFGLDDETFESSVNDIVTKLKNPSRVLRTGIKKLNSILSPGYMGGRLYIYLGLPGGWKSGMLLKTCRDIKMYNQGDIVTKKPGKTPCVLMITMENSLDETVERLFNMTVTSDDIRNYTPKQVIKMLKDQGKMTLKDKNEINIIIEYRANRSIDTSDLYTIIEDLLDEGQEVIALVLDYIKRIKPAEKGKDEKEELKNITNELNSLAKALDIPVISAHQLNRSGAANVDAAMQANKEDVARFVGRSNVGSAWEVIENSDWNCIINVEKKRNTGQYYLTFKRVKMRYRDIGGDELGYFNHPFEGENRMMLIDDLYLDKSLSEDSLVSDFDGVDLSNKKGNRTAIERDIEPEEDPLSELQSLNKNK